MTIVWTAIFKIKTHKYLCIIDPDRGYVTNDVDVRFRRAMKFGAFHNAICCILDSEIPSHLTDL